MRVRSKQPAPNRGAAMDYVFHERPSEVWAVEYTSIGGERVVIVIGTKGDACETAAMYTAGDPVLLCSATDFRPA
jgi:hypothetical protein